MNEWKAQTAQMRSEWKEENYHFFNAHPRSFLFLFCLFLSIAPWNQNHSPTLWLGRPRLKHEVVQLRSHTMSVVDVTFKTPGLSGWILAKVPWMGMWSKQTPWTKISYLLQQGWFNRCLNWASQANKYIRPRQAQTALSPIGLGLVCRGPAR